MKSGSELLGLAQQQRMLLIQCLLEELEEGALTDALKAAAAANDQLIATLQRICREGADFRDRGQDGANPKSTRRRAG
jgi:hypothetical protein